MPGVTRAELIEGIVYMPSPVRLRAHSRPHQIINTWLGNYWVATPGTESGDNGTVFLDLDNEAQPDAYLRIVEAAGGASRANAADYLEGPPELIFEIAGSSANYDLHQKKEAYRRNGVQEYAVWRTEDGAIDWWQLVDGDYSALPADAAGIVSSRVFPGLLLDIQALLQDRIADVMATLQRGLASSGHSAWAESLKARVR